MTDNKEDKSSGTKQTVNDMFAKWDAEKKAKEKENENKFVILARKNLGNKAHLVRASAMSAVKGLSPFDSVKDAAAWIKSDGDIENVYEICDSATKQTIFEKWVHDPARKWHTTTFKQDPNRGYKSDKNHKLRMILGQ
jgi:hypothetical protein